VKEDLIRIEDYKRYLIEYSIPRWKKRSEEAKAKYNAAKQEYESGWFAKLFGCKFEHSEAVRWGWWDFHEAEIEAREVELARCNYFEKLFNTHIQSALDIHEAFYSWCEENKVPY
jgi:hypothetical protein